MSEAPALSVIVPVVTGEAAVAGCLEALRAAGRNTPLEVIAPNRCGAELGRTIRGRFPEVNATDVPPRTSIPRMRSLGVRNARAPVVAVIEDHVIVPPDWPARLLEALRAGADVVSGTIVNGAMTSIVDRAAFLCEYSHLLPPPARGADSPITGNNVAYRRSVLDACGQILEDERWEDDLHACLRAAGGRFVLDPEIVVTHRRHYGSAWEYVRERYWHSRSRIGPRATATAAPRRAFMACASLALPPILLYRICRRVALRRGLLYHVVPTFPLLLVFVVAWALGEVVGWIAGPGDALSRVT